MQNDEVEQTEQSVSKIGKFNTADDLLHAYNALESEFTKRCQLVKELQTELESLRAQAEADGRAESEDGQTGDNAASENANIPNDIESDIPPENSQKRDEYSGVLDEVARNAAVYAELLAVVPEVMDACIARYKARLIESPSVGSPSGMAVIVPAKRPKTLSEAKRLADSMLNGNVR